MIRSVLQREALALIPGFGRIHHCSVMQYRRCFHLMVYRAGSLVVQAVGLVAVPSAALQVVLVVDTSEDRDFGFPVFRSMLPRQIVAVLVVTEMAVAVVLGRQLTQAVKEPSVVASDKKADMFLPKAVRNRKQTILPPYDIDADWTRFGARAA